jgi:hypothetical protein
VAARLDQDADAFNAARQKMLPGLSRKTPAERYLKR